MSDPTRIEMWVETQWRLCKQDPLFFFENYWKIPIVGKGYSKFELRDYQRKDVQRMVDATTGQASTRQVRLKARQIGWTTLAAAFAFHNAFFNPHHDWIIASQGESEAKDTLSTKIKQPYAQLPGWLRQRGPKSDTDTQEEFGFENGSRILSIPSTSKAGRSKSVYGVIKDESAFVENAGELFAALDPLCYGPMFVFSTANGMGNWFHKIWLEAQLKDSEWEAGFHPWSAVPERDEKWYARMQRRYRTEPHLFYQEYPATPEEAFAKSGRTALPMDALRDEMHWCPPDVRYDCTLLEPHNSPIGATIPAGEERDIELHVWQQPYVERGPDGRLWRKPNFVVGVDVSEGLIDGDYTAINVFDANDGEQVAALKAHVSIEDIGPLAEWIGYWYYTALILVERNNMGLVPLTYLQQAQYPRLYRMDSIATIRKGDRTPRYGFFTNKSSKPKMIVEFNKAVKDGKVVLHDDRFLHEASTFVSDGKGGYSASQGNHDDEVMATLISWQGVLEVGEYPIVWQDSVRGPTTMGEVLRPATRAPKLALAGGIGQRQYEGAVRGFEIVR